MLSENQCALISKSMSHKLMLLCDKGRTDEHQAPLSAVPEPFLIGVDCNFRAAKAESQHQPLGLGLVKGSSAMHQIQRGPGRVDPPPHPGTLQLALSLRSLLRVSSCTARCVPLPSLTALLSAPPSFLSVIPFSLLTITLLCPPTIATRH
jgi:hypothetical protein